MATTVQQGLSVIMIFRSLSPPLRNSLRMDYVEWVRLRNWPDTDSTRFKLTEYRQSVLVLHIKGP